LFSVPAKEAVVPDELIVSDPDVMAGQPVVAGTRLTVDKLLESLAGGATVDQLIEAHPALSREGIEAALRFAAETVRTSSPVSVTMPTFATHGPHSVNVNREPGVAVRVFAPEAQSVAVQRQDTAAGEQETEVRGRGAEGPGLPPGPHPPQPGPTDLASIFSLGTQPDPLLPVEPPEPVLFPMERVHPEGVFEAVFAGEAEFFPYRFVVTLPDGRSYVADDPYRFPPLLADSDLRLPQEAEHSAECLRRLYSVLGAHPVQLEGVSGVRFAVWAPKASRVSVIGDFNHWDGRFHPMRLRGNSGLWELFIPGLAPGTLYKYEVQSQDGTAAHKADPCGFYSELRPGNASVVWDLEPYQWNDSDWMTGRRDRQKPCSPISIYEVHLGSWMHAAPQDAEPERWLTYRELADKLIAYVKEMGYTHIELMPVAEHPLDGSWGYQSAGYFAPTSRYGNPDDFRHFVDTAHQAGLGVIMDWVPAHFPKDAHGLSNFDGTPLYEHPDPRRSHQRDWGTFTFDFECPEVRAFLLSNAMFWLDKYHIDGLRVDAVSSMLYLDYSRAPGEWLPNRFGGREHLEVIEFFKRFNTILHQQFPDVMTFAEESSAWPKITGPVQDDGLGFDFKWNMGWMHDTLKYFREDPIYRRHHHDKLTFSLTYAFSEKFTLAFSHDEVVHGKGAMLSKMPGDYRQKFANLRALYGYMYGHPGKKLLFMSCEIGQWTEWNFEKGVEWELLGYDSHRQLRDYVAALNRLYVSEPALHEVDFSWQGFEWIDCDDQQRSILSFVRRSENPDEFIVVAANFTPVLRHDLRIGVPGPGRYRELFNSDAAIFGGNNFINAWPLSAEAGKWQHMPWSIRLTLPPMAVLFLKPLPPRHARESLHQTPSQPERQAQ
jgi:1,4-alpha-glucan branching enzyme